MKHGLITEQRDARQVDIIREFALREFVLPAANDGAGALTIRAGDVAAPLKLAQRMPAVCSAISRNEFLSAAGLVLSSEHPNDGPDARFEFEVIDTDLTPSEAERLITILLGEPQNSNDQMVDWTLPDGSQFALQKDISAVQVWAEVGDHEPPFSLNHRLHQRVESRHTALPRRLLGTQLGSSDHLAPIVSARAANRSDIFALLDWRLGSSLGLNRAELAKLKNIFLGAYPDFAELTFSASEGGYFEEERRYKQALIDRATDIFKQPARAPEQLGGKLLDLLSGKEAGLLGWRTDGRIKNLRAAHPGVLEKAAGKLALSSEKPSVSVAAFVAETWPTLREGQKSLPYSESRNLPSMLLALVRPEEALGINTTPLWNAGKRLLQRSLYGNNPLTSSEYEEVLAFGNQLFQAMASWGWNPRDLWDVQGVIWAVAHKDKMMTNEQTLAHFDVNEGFKQSRSTWNEEKTDAFCRIALAVHESGLDWWFVKSSPYQLRFGRKKPGATDATAVQGYVANYQEDQPRVWQNDVAHCLDLDFDDGPLSSELAEELEEALKAASDEISNWYKPTPPRPASWPDNSTMEDPPKARSSAAPSTNIILYGPPGTGKTFHTTAKAIELIDGVSDLPFGEARDRYEQLREAGQIRFVTFHQSYSYEDFVEGLRPETGGNDDEESEASAGFRLEPRDGIFREISKLAEQARKTSGKGGDFDLAERQFFKMSLGRAGSEDHIYDAAIEGGYIVLGWGGEVDWSDPRYDEYQAIHDKWNEIEPGTSGNAGNISQVWRFRSSMNVGDIVIVSEGNSKFRAIGVVKSDYYFEPTDVRTYNHRRDVDWLVVLDEALPVETIYDGAFTMQSCYPLKTAKVKKEGVARLLPTDEPAYQGAPDQFVLIIDEINRANVSKVFGELITLLEPDKRLGAKNELKVKLPYSGDTFGVPSNLHVIGTMNTADRSIALLDTALRRRFRFEELMPRPELLPTNVDGINLQRLLQALNDRIEYLFDRDHQIGHAYFWDCGSRDDVDDVMRNKVIPLLTEYFYEEWDRVRQALNETKDDGSFIRRTKLSSPSAESDQYASDRYRYEVKFPFSPEAYEQLT